MTHLDEGRLLALRDVADGSDTRAASHLAACDTCRALLDAVRRQEATISEALLSLDETWDLEAARERIRAEIAEGAAEEAGVVGRIAPRRFSWSLSRAAGLILVTAAGAAAAIPGSPVREWLTGTLSERTPRSAQPAAVDAPDVATSRESAGVRLAVGTGPVRIVITGLPPATEVRVQLVPGSEAAVLAPAGARFTSGEGRIEAVTETGPVRVELPRGAVPATVEVNGRVYLRNTAEGLDDTASTWDRDGSDLVLRLPGG